MDKQGRHGDSLISAGGEASIWRSFFFNISAIITLFVLGIFLGIQLNNERLIHNELYTRAKADFENIVATRMWNAKYHGVYVEKTEGVESNPYLKDPDIMAADGKVYTKKNPALMTREISELLSERSGHSFHITSLKPLNPDNRADAFEVEALKAFEEGEKERFRIEREGERSYFRFMAPLFVESSCMACHAQQGYSIGDVRGGISVRFDVSDVETRLDWNRYAIWGISLLISLLLVGIIYSFVRRMKHALDEANARIRKLAITDELTSLCNRRCLMKRLDEEFERSSRYGHPLVCMMIDIDHFKAVNDQYGHAAGDHVLKSMAHLMTVQERTTDVIARYGGEEFVILLPETGEGDAVQVAERMRRMIEAAPITLDDGTLIHITVSIGLCALQGEGLGALKHAKQLIEIADQALYRAKELGRNRVVSRTSLS